MSSVHRTYQIRGYTTSQGYGRLDTVLRQCAVLYNAALEEWKTAYKVAGVSRTYYDQCKQLTLVRADDPELWGALNVRIGRGVLRRLGRARQAFFRRVKAGQTPGYPRFKSGRRWHTIQIEDGVKSMLKQVGNHYVVKVKGLPAIRLKPGRELPEVERLKSLTITRRGRRLFVNLTYELAAVDVAAAVRDTAEIPVADFRGSPTQRGVHLVRFAHRRRLVGSPTQRGVHPTYIGIDLGVTDRIAMSNGETIDRRAKPTKRISRAQVRLSRCKKGSRRWRERRAVLSNIQHRERVANRNECHRITTELVRRFDLIAVEDLAIGNMMRSAKGTVESPGKNVKQKAGLNRAIAEQTWGIILDQLAYKAEGAGKQVVRVSAPYTSQTCSECGRVDSDARSGKDYCCARCGNRMDADVNAANNILTRGIEMAAGNLAVAAP